jgi:Holliday junction resolvasome RuvABC endonuclease subunit
MSPINKRLAKPSKILVFDPSSSHLAFAVAEIVPGESYRLLEAGIVWAADKWGSGQKYNYMYTCLERLINSIQPDAIITEAFFSNPKMRVGMSVIPTINAFMQMIIYKSGRDITYEEVSPTAWRKPLGIKADLNAGKKDFKAPTKRKVEELLGKLPEELISNITGNLRSLPTDVPDAIAISLYIGLEHNVKSIDKDINVCYNKYSSVMKGYVDVK